MAEAADPDHDGGGLGGQQGQRVLDGVVGREPRVGERRGLDWVKVVEWHEVAGVGHEHELRHTAVAAEPATAVSDLRHVLAHILRRERARLAATAAPDEVHGDRFALAEARHARARCRHPAGVLVAERERRPSPRHAPAGTP